MVYKKFLLFAIIYAQSKIINSSKNKNVKIMDFS